MQMRSSPNRFSISCVSSWILITWSSCQTLRLSKVIVWSATVASIKNQKWVKTSILMATMLMISFMWFLDEKLKELVVKNNWSKIFMRSWTTKKCTRGSSEEKRVILRLDQNIEGRKHLGLSWLLKQANSQDHRKEIDFHIVNTVQGFIKDRKIRESKWKRLDRIIWIKKYRIVLSNLVQIIKMCQFEFCMIGSARTRMHKFSNSNKSIQLKRKIFLKTGNICRGN